MVLETPYVAGSDTSGFEYIGWCLYFGLLSQSSCVTKPQTTNQVLVDGFGPHHELEGEFVDGLL